MAGVDRRPKAVHKAVVDVADEDGVEGLILHLVHATEQGFAVTEVWESKEQMKAATGL